MEIAVSMQLSYTCTKPVCLTKLKVHVQVRHVYSSVYVHLSTSVCGFIYFVM